MNLEKELNCLEKITDGYVPQESHEQGSSNAESPTKQADYHLRLGRLLHGRFLQGVKALKHFQDAFKLNPALTEALGEARGIYWELGKLNMVQKLLELQLKNSDGVTASSLYVQLGDVLCDLGDQDRAMEAYARALQSAQGKPSPAGELLHDVQVGESDWQERVATLLRGGREATTAKDKAGALLRAARITGRFAPDEVRGMPSQAYSAAPTDVVVASLFEDLLARAEKTDEILQVQRDILESVKNPSERASVAFCFGTRWAIRHQNHDLGTEFIQLAIDADPSNEAAFAYLREVYGTMGGDWAKVTLLADSLAKSQGDAPNTAFLLASAGLSAWQKLGDLIKARSYFERLAKVAPDHGALKAFEKQIGQAIPRSGDQPEIGRASCRERV